MCHPDERQDSGEGEPTVIWENLKGKILEETTHSRPTALVLLMKTKTNTQRFRLKCFACGVLHLYAARITLLFTTFEAIYNLPPISSLAKADNSV